MEVWKYEKNVFGHLLLVYVYDERRTDKYTGSNFELDDMLALTSLTCLCTFSFSVSMSVGTHIYF